MCIVDRAVIDMLAVAMRENAIAKRTFKQVVEEFNCTFSQLWTVSNLCSSAVTGLLNINDAALRVDVTIAQCVTLAIGCIGNNSDASLLDC